MNKKVLISLVSLFVVLGMAVGGRVLGAGECTDPVAQGNFDVGGCGNVHQASCDTHCSPTCTWDATAAGGAGACVATGAGGAVTYVPDVDLISELSLSETIVVVLNAVMGFLGFIAVSIILYGGFQWMTAAGDDSKVGKAKKTLSAGVIGLIIILASWGIASFVFGLFGIGTKAVNVIP